MTITPELQTVLALLVLFDTVLIGFIIVLVKEKQEIREKWADSIKESRDAQQTLEYIRKVLDGPRTIESLLHDYDNPRPMKD